MPSSSCCITFDVPLVVSIDYVHRSCCTLGRTYLRQYQHQLFFKADIVSVVSVEVRIVFDVKHNRKTALRG